MLHFYNYYSMHALSDNFARTAVHDFVHLYSIDSVFFLILPKNHCVFQLVVDLGSWWCWIHELKSCGTKKGKKKDEFFLLYLSSSRIFQITNPNFGQPNPLLILNIHIREATFYFLKYRKCNPLINKKSGRLWNSMFFKKQN